MSELVRLSFSIEEPLNQQLESLLSESGYANRSEFIRDMIRERLVEEDWRRGEEAVGTITIIYNHETRLLSARLTSVQHKRHDNILASTHVHLDHHLCAEMIMVKGRPSEIRELSEELRRQKGVLHLALSMSSTGHHLA